MPVVNTDQFSDRQKGLGSPADAGVAITPSDTDDLEFASRAIWVGAAGNIKVDFVNGGTGIIIVGIPTGTLLPFRVKKIYSTSTTATSIVAVR